MDTAGLSGLTAPYCPVLGVLRKGAPYLQLGACTSCRRRWWGSSARSQGSPGPCRSSIHGVQPLQCQGHGGTPHISLEETRGRSGLQSRTRAGPGPSHRSSLDASCAGPARPSPVPQPAPTRACIGDRWTQTGTCMGQTETPFSAHRGPGGDAHPAHVPGCSGGCNRKSHPCHSKTVPALRQPGLAHEADGCLGQRPAGDGAGALVPALYTPHGARAARSRGEAIDRPDIQEPGALPRAPRCPGK